MKHFTMKHQLPYYFSLCFVLLLLGAQAGFGQVTVNFVMSPRPSPYLSDWEQRHETVQLTVIDNDPYAETLTRFQASVSRNGQVVARTKQQSMPIVQLRRGQNTFNAVSIFPLAAVEFVGNIDKSTQRSGMLPEGNYSICVQLTDIETGAVIADAGCQSFLVLDVRPPQPIAPGIATALWQDNESHEVELSNQVVFQWLPAVPVPETPRYIFRILPVEAGQNPNAVTNSRKPIYEVTSLTPHLIVPLPQILGANDSTHGVAWNVQAIDGAGRPLGANSGMSQTFFVQFTNDNTPKDSTKPERPPIPADRRTVPVEELGRDTATIPPVKPDLCGHKVREFVRREVGEWARKEKIDSDMSLEKPLRPAAKTDITWTREIRTVYKAKTCVLPKGHGGAHKYGPAAEETDVKVVEETLTYWEGEDQVPPKDHWTDHLPR